MLSAWEAVDAACAPTGEDDHARQAGEGAERREERGGGVRVRVPGQAVWPVRGVRGRAGERGARSVPAWTLGPLPGWVASVVETEQLGVEIVSTESGAGGSPAPCRWVPSRFTRVASWFHHPELRTYQTFVQPDVLR